MTHKIFSRRKVGLPASRSTMNRTPTPAARANYGCVSPSRLRAKRNALPSCRGDRMDIIVQLIYRSGYYWIILAFQKTYFPIGIFLASGFTIKESAKNVA